MSNWNGLDIYFRISHDDGISETWYTIDANTFACNPSIIGTLRPEHITDSSCCSNGQYIYMTGGLNKKMEARRIGRSPDATTEVYYIDTHDVEKSGWIPAKSMRQKRVSHYMCLVDQEMYAVGGYPIEPGHKNIYIESYNYQNDKWTTIVKNLEQDVPENPNGHAFALNNMGHNLFLFHSLSSQKLFYHDKKTNFVGVYDEEFGINKQSSAFVDDILYYLDSRNPGSLYAYDCNSNFYSKRVIVTENNVLPRSDLNISQVTTHLVSLENGMLGVVWATKANQGLQIGCSKFHMEKRQDQLGRLYSFRANLINHNQWNVDICGHLDTCLGVLPSWDVGVGGKYGQSSWSSSMQWNVGVGGEYGQSSWSSSMQQDIGYYNPQGC